MITLEVNLLKKHILTLLVALFSLSAISACNGGGGRIVPPPPAGEGSISGSFVVNNTLAADAVFHAQLFKKGLDAPVDQATLTLSGTAYAYEFTELDLDTYIVRLHMVSGDLAMTISETGEIELTSDNPDRTSITTDAIGGDGTLSGSVKTAGVFPVELVVYVYAYRTDVTLPPGPPDGVNSFAFNVTADMLAGDSFDYNIENMSYGVYHIQLVGYDPVSHEITVYGEFATAVKIDLYNTNPEGKRFAAGFGVAPPPLENGTIRGTVAFTGNSDFTQLIYVSANTIPPAQGAPPASFQITASNYVAAGMDFELTGLPLGDYRVSLFEYNFTTHQATYFGQYDDNGGVVTVDSATDVIEDIDFTADWSLLD